MNRERGFALIAVLWAMGLLALLVAQFTSTGRTEIRVAANLRTNAILQSAADGAVHEAILRLLQGVWMPDGLARVIRVGNSVVEVHIRNEAWKLNPNTASAPALQSLLAGLGVESGKRAALARAIVDWRSGGSRSESAGSKLLRYQAAGLPYGPANQPFESLDEIGLVIGMTPELLARMKPLLSIHTESDGLADDEAFQSAGKTASARTGGGWQFGSTGRIMAVTIEASAIAVKGGQFTRQAVVRLRADPSLDQAPYQILTWKNPSE
jgi:general secretion pathway protein K